MAPGFRVVHVPTRKDSADIALSLDALELGLTKQVDEIILATSDRDMSLVAQRLGELGIPVTGIGEDKAPDDFRKACRTFVAVPGKKCVGETQPFDARMKDFLRQEGKKTEGWVTLSALGQSRAKSLDISKASAGIGKSASWIDWFKKHPSVYEIEERGTQSRARLKPVR